MPGKRGGSPSTPSTPSAYPRTPSTTGETRPAEAYIAAGLGSIPQNYTLANKTDAGGNILPYNPNAKTPSAPKAPSGSGGGSGAGIGMNLDPIYAALRDELTKQRLASGQGIDQSIAATKGFYDDATGDMYDAYQNSRNDLEGRAGNLGVDFDQSSMGLQWDAALRRLQEMSDSNETSDLTYFEKMKGLSNTAYDSLLQGVAQDLLNRKMGLAAGGGGSYRGGGGGGGSGATSNKDTATQTSTISNVGDTQFLNELMGSNPLAGKLLYNAYNSAGWDPGGAAAKVMQYKAPVITGDMTRGYNNIASAATKAIAAKVAAAKAEALKALQGFGGVLGNPAITQKVTSTGSQSWKS